MFHMECGIKSFIENDAMTCPMCRNPQNFLCGMDEVYMLALIEQHIENESRINDIIIKNKTAKFVFVIKNKKYKVMEYYAADDKRIANALLLHANNNCAIKEALSGNSYDITKLCLENIVDPNHTDNVDNVLECSNNIIDVRDLIIEYAIKKTGNVMFSRIICNAKIYDKTALELYDFFYSKTKLIFEALRNRNKTIITVSTDE